MILTATQLNGTNSRIAELMGKPHVGAFYMKENYRTHTLMEDAKCCVCGSPAVDAHHVVPRGQAYGFTVNTPLGRFVTLSPLFAVCRRCHNSFPSGHSLEPSRYSVEWVWRDGRYQEEWWSGHTLSHVCRPHSPFLWQEGFYVVHDREGADFEIGGNDVS